MEKFLLMCHSAFPIATPPTNCVGDWDIRRAQLHQCWRQKIGCAIALLSWKCIENVDGKKLSKALFSEISIATPHSDYVFCTLNSKTCEKKYAIFRLVHVVFAEWPVNGPHWARHLQLMKQLHTKTFKIDFSCQVNSRPTVRSGSLNISRVV